ncbi:hypothetical protein ZHAS_00010872 [Anopheles sinensis]|uniref:Uncharacterized protein n=1 Tax=Anopheles sinensis TaxID=74873 RepID=A0A084VYF1_ANOSI|nr:hypothetical protein ZHAS_00010872 [Anopheles sinensis]
MTEARNLACTSPVVFLAFPPLDNHRSIDYYDFLWRAWRQTAGPHHFARLIAIDLPPIMANHVGFLGTRDTVGHPAPLEGHERKWLPLRKIIPMTQ